MSAPEPPPSASGQASQRFSLFHDANEAGLKGWHAPYAGAFPAGPVADLGCGPGYFLDLLRDRGIAGVGIDIDPAMVEEARRRGHEAIAGNHATLSTMPEAFNGIHLSHVIEHLWGDEAIELLEGAKTALRTNGMLIVRTPNWANANVRHGGFWLDHTHKRPYPKELLEKLLSDLGFDILQSGFEPGAWEDTYIVARKRAEESKTSMRRTAITAGPQPPSTRPTVAPAPGLRYKIDWRGDFLGQHSFARVNRDLARAVAATGVVEIVPQGEPTPAVELALGLPMRRADESSAGLPTFALKHQWPPVLLRPQHGYSLHIQPFEFGALPKSWADQMPSTVDDVWCPSAYVQSIYVDAGMPVERTFVLPWGVDPETYHPGVEPADLGSADTFVFLFVGGTIWRKGIDLLIDAYVAEFGRSDDVALIVKSYGSGTFYVDQNLTARILELSRQPDTPTVRLSEEVLSEPALASLYRRADILILPYRGEGFGLPVLEAMACGTPPIVTAGGATDDFVTDETGYRLPSYRRPVGTLDSGEILVNPGWVMEVDLPTLRRSMRHAFEHRDEVRDRGARAAATVRERFLWSHSAQRVLARLDELATREPLARTGTFESINAYERRKRSQNGEDGIIEELFSRLRVTDPFFAEIGVETGVECNTAELAQRWSWAGVMFEGSDDAFAGLKQTYADFPNVRPVHAMVTRENVAELFTANGVPQNLDLLSIDVDGNDYYLWEALASYRARIVIVEINPGYPPLQRWVMDYNPNHVWQHDDYYGASLASLTALADRLGYALLGIEDNVVNAFFIRRDLLDIVGFPERTPEAVFRVPKYHFPHRDGPSTPL